ncbi:hypothetical protein ACR9PT_10095 [Piscirickettsia salmonis]|uniref:hypothetical protein n=1 Tax=Piscirickettsia salmonis TaxID=1238 RepID=UPI003EBE79C2
MTMVFEERLSYVVNLLASGQKCLTEWVMCLNQQDQDNLEQALLPLLMKTMASDLALSQCAGYIDLYHLLVGQHAPEKEIYKHPESDINYLYGDWVNFITNLSERWTLLGVESGQTLFISEKEPLKVMLAALTGFKLGLHVVFAPAHGDIYIQNRAREIRLDYCILPDQNISTQVLPCFFNRQQTTTVIENYQYGRDEVCLSCFSPQGDLYTVTANQFILQRLRDCSCVFGLHLSSHSTLCTHSVELFVWLAFCHFLSATTITHVENTAGYIAHRGKVSLYPLFCDQGFELELLEELPVRYFFCQFFQPNTLNLFGKNRLIGHLAYGGALVELSSANYIKPILFSRLSTLKAGELLSYLHEGKIYQLSAVVQQQSGQYFLSVDVSHYFNFYIKEIKNYLSDCGYETVYIWWDELREQLICLIFTGDSKNANNKQELWVQEGEVQSLRAMECKARGE